MQVQVFRPSQFRFPDCSEKVLKPDENAQARAAQAKVSFLEVTETKKTPLLQFYGSRRTLAPWQFTHEVDNGKMYANLWLDDRDYDQLMSVTQSDFYKWIYDVKKMGDRVDRSGRRAYPDVASFETYGTFTFVKSKTPSNGKKFKNDKGYMEFVRPYEPANPGEELVYGDGLLRVGLVITRNEHGENVSVEVEQVSDYETIMIGRSFNFKELTSMLCGRTIKYFQVKMMIYESGALPGKVGLSLKLHRIGVSPIIENNEGHRSSNVLTDDEFVPKRQKIDPDVREPENEDYDGDEVLPE